MTTVIVAYRARMENALVKLTIALVMAHHAVAAVVVRPGTSMGGVNADHIDEMMMVRSADSFDRDAKRNRLRVATTSGRYAVFGAVQQSELPG